MSNLKAFSQARAQREDEEIAALEAEQQEDQELQEELSQPAPSDPVEANWAKRYADLRAHTAKQQKDWKAREAELQKQAEAARQSQPNAVPVTEEELEDYINTYPKVGALINKIVENQLQSRMKGSEEKLAELEADREALKEEKAKKALAKRVPEFFGDDDGLLSDGSQAIVARPEFNDWVMSTQDDPEDGWIFEAIYQSLNVGQAAAAINLWKSETGFSVGGKPKRKTKAKSDADAASSVRTAGKPTISESGKGDYDYSDSQVARMSSREFEQHEEAIEKAQREGRYLYDLSA